jgi:hypothetical protein
MRWNLHMDGLLCNMTPTPMQGPEGFILSDCENAEDLA